jgi:hypothetical protein
LGRPASEALPEPLAGEPSHEQVVAALRSLDSFVDISEEDLIQLSRMLAMGRRLQSDKGKDSLVLEAQA